jgi:hypothetical protein
MTTASIHNYEDYEQFETVTEAEVDGRGRVSLARAGAEPGRRYRVRRNVDGILLLIPVVSIPEREMIVWNNPGLAAEIREGLAAAERGDTVDLGSFSEYAEEDDEDSDQD